MAVAPLAGLAAGGKNQQFGGDLVSPRQDMQQLAKTFDPGQR